jgi:hypothetical protein
MLGATQNRRDLEIWYYEGAGAAADLCSFLIWALSSLSYFSFCAVVDASWTLHQMSSKISWPSTTAFRTRSISL